MHFSLMEHIKRKNDLDNPQVGIVVFNNDPKKLGRVKVKIKGLLEESNTDKLPWCYPRMPLNTFGGKGQFLSVPNLESKIVVEFDYGDINFPAYTGYWNDKTNTPSHADLTSLSSLFKADYPNVQGWQDEIGNYEAHNVKEKFIEYGYHSGYKRRIDKDGKLSDKALKEYLIEVLNKYQVDANNILLGTGSSEHKELVTKDHLAKYDALITSVDTWITGVTPILTAAALLAGIATLPATSGAWVASVPLNKENNTNKTSQTKAK